jgi:hypothetical protein
MAKFGWDERRLFNVSESALENLSSTPSDADVGQMLLYIKSDHLYIKKPSLSEVLIVEDGLAIGSTPGGGSGGQIFKQKNASGQLEFRRLVSTDGRLDIVEGTDTVSLTVDFSDINDDLDHGALLGLSDDDHTQYLLLAGRSSGQTANGGIAASGNLTLRSTSHGTKGSVKIDDGSKFEFNSKTHSEHEVQTTSATATTIATIPLADDTVYLVRAEIIGRRTDGGGEARGIYVLEGAFFRAAAGSATQQGNTQQQFKTESNNALDANFTVSGNNLLVQVQGIAAQTFDWKAQVQLIAQN